MMCLYELVRDEKTCLLPSVAVDHEMLRRMAMSLFLCGHQNHSYCYLIGLSTAHIECSETNVSTWKVKSIHPFRTICITLCDRDSTSTSWRDRNTCRHCRQNTEHLTSILSIVSMVDVSFMPLLMSLSLKNMSKYLHVF